MKAGVTAEIQLVAGRDIKVTTNNDFKDACTDEVLWVDYKTIVDVVDVGKNVYIDDGLISLIVKEKGPDFLLCTIQNGGSLGSKKGCNLPGTPVDLPAVSSQDKEDLLFGIEMGVDIIFASFIRSGDGIRIIRGVLGEKGRHIKVSKR